MAEIDYMEDYGGYESARTGAGVDFGKWANLSGAVVSLALIAGLSVWGYKLLMRDVTGVPVVKAMEGAFRVAPDDPGGMRAPHQGLAVNEIAAIGGAGGPADTVTLAPPPMVLTDEDRANAALERMAAVDAETTAPRDAPAMFEEAEATPRAADFTDLAEAQAGPVIEDTPDGALATDMAVAEALSAPIEEEGPDGEELAVLAPEVRATIEAEMPERSAARSPRPVERPRGLAQAAAAPRDTGTVETVANDPAADLPKDEVSVAELALGTRLVQLGAFASADVARDQWVQISGRFPDYFEGKRRVVQKASSGGKTFYRLRAEGFTDLADTRRFCTALVAGRADCIPVELR